MARSLAGGQRGRTLRGKSDGAKFAKGFTIALRGVQLDDQSE